MTRDEAVQNGMTALNQSQTQALGVAFDAGANSIPADVGGKQFAQSDIDAAIAKVTADDQAHMKELSDKVDMDAESLEAIKASMRDALAQALSLVSPGPSSSATQQTVPASVAPGAPQTQVSTEANAVSGTPPAPGDQV